MADDTEVFEIQVTDVGTSAVIAQLQTLGLTGEQAAARVASGYTRISTSATGATSNLVLMNRAAQSGTEDMAGLSDALDLLTNAELRAAERAGAFTTAQDGATAATTRGTRAADAHAGAIGSLSGAYSKLGSVLVGVAGYLGLHEFIEASDAATTFRNRLTAVIDTADTGSTSLNRFGTQILSFGKNSLIAEEHTKDLNEALKLPTAADGLKTAQQALADFDSGLDNSASAAAKANQAQSSFARSLGAVSKNVSSITDVTDSYYKAVEIGSAVTQDAGERERTRAGLIDQVRDAMVAVTAEQDKAGISLRSYAAESAATAEADRTFTAAAIATGTDREKIADLFVRIANGAKEANVSLKDTEAVTVLVAEQLRRFGVSGRQATSSMNELAEGFSEGTLKGKQLQAIIREFPQLLQPVADKLTGGSIQKLAENFKTSGISVQQFTSAYLAQSDTIKAASDKVTLSIGGAFQSLKTKFDDYIGSNERAGAAADFLVSAIGRLGDALPVLIPLVATLAIGFAALKFASYASAAITFVASLGPLGIVLGVIGGAIAYLVDGYANYLVSTGQAKDKSDALYQTLQLFRPIYDDIKTAIGNAVASFNTFFASFGTGATNASVFKGAIQEIVNVVRVLIIVITSLGSVIGNIFAVAIQAAQNFGTVIGNIINRVKAIGTNQDFGSITEGTKPITTPFRDGGVIYARDGISVGTHMRVPGADRPDTVPLAMMVSKGERVIVQTEDQQAKHDKIMSAFRNGGIAMPHFAAGGFVIADGSNTLAGFGVSSSDSTTGFSGSSYAAANYQAPTATPAAGTSPTDSKAAISQQTKDSKNNAWANRNTYGSDAYIQDQTALKGSLFPYPGLDTTGGNWPGVQHHVYTNGKDPFMFAYDGSKPTTQDANVGPSGERISYGFFQGQPQFALPSKAEAWYTKLNYGRPPPNLDTLNHDANHPNFRDGGMIYARDGVDFTVPGAGPVDSRSLAMAVSPGERVRVDTADQVAQDGKGAGTVRRTPAMPITIVASDPGAFGRSKRQITDAIAKGVRRSPL